MLSSITTLTCPNHFSYIDWKQIVRNKIFLFSKYLHPRARNFQSCIYCSAEKQFYKLRLLKYVGNRKVFQLRSVWWVHYSTLMSILVNDIAPWFRKAHFCGMSGNSTSYWNCSSIILLLWFFRSIACHVL